MVRVKAMVWIMVRVMVRARARARARARIMVWVKVRGRTADFCNERNRGCSDKTRILRKLYSYSYRTSLDRILVFVHHNTPSTTDNDLVKFFNVLNFSVNHVQGS